MEKLSKLSGNPTRYGEGQSAAKSFRQLADRRRSETIMGVS